MAIDLKYAYFHVLNLPRHGPFLWFAFEGRAYQYKVHPFGLSLSPHVRLYEDFRDCPCPTEGGGHPHTQLPRRLSKSSSLARVAVCTEGPGPQALSLIGTLGQLGEEQALPRTKHLFSQCGVLLDCNDSTSFLGMCTVSA